MSKPDEKTHFFDKPGNVQRVLRIFYACCALLLLAELFVHRHIETALEGLLGFYPLYGFIACVVLVLIAKQMRKVLMRDEDYYDRDDD